MKPLELFSPTVGPGEVSNVFDLTPDELKALKLRAAEAMVASENILDAERVAALIQLISFMRVEMPQFFSELLGLDVESSAVFAAAVIDGMCMTTTRSCPSWAVQDIEALPINRGITIYSTAFIEFITDALGRAAPFAFDFANDSGAENDLALLDALQDGFALYTCEAFQKFNGEIYLTPEIATTVKLKAAMRGAI